MTTIPPAQPRPPSATIGPAFGSGLPHIHPTGQAERLVEREQVDRDEVEFVESRPVKRRKLSTGGATNVAAADVVKTPVTFSHDNGGPSAQYAPASWLAVSSSRPPAFRGDGHLSANQTLAFPERPWTTPKTQETSADSGRLSSRIRQNNVVPTTPDSIMIPAAAPRLEDGRRAGYFPWVGKHPEDNLNESTVKSGYFDRAPNPLEKELNTAKAPLYNAFKHRAGLESLSALFSLVLNQKSARGNYSSISSFRGPPPRVTLTELKRKSWINDLANIAVPLKRLSKTIPQGIRGQLLLDQCLSNSVPLSRAIWFAKCVGANEIRTLKRKGINPVVAQGAEAKWLREWTINVEQFVETNILQCGQNEWKEKATYVFQLATRMYAENLLDRDHYLDWLVKSLSASNICQAPFWLMITHTHRADLLAFRKRGKQFAEVLVSKVNSVHTQIHEFFAPLAAKFGKLLKESVRSQPMCFLMPDRWVECKRALGLCLEMTSRADQLLLDRLEHVNERTRTQSPYETTDLLSPTERIIETLDSARAPFDVESLNKTLFEICTNHALLANACLQWCVSRYRSGLSKIYLTVRLFRRWQKSGLDIDHIFQTFLQHHVGPLSTDFSALRHTTSELSRSHTLSVSKYLQWLTVRGLPRPDNFSVADLLVYTTPDGENVFTQSSDANTQLLTECCLVGHGKHVRNLRDMVLERGGYDHHNEAYLIAQCELYIGRIATNPESLSQEHRRPVFSQLSWSIRTQLAHYIRRLVVKMSNIPPAGTEVADTQLRSELSLVQLGILRDVLEELQDMAILADVLRLAVFSKQDDVLALITDTVNFHSEAFSAMGALHSLQTLLCRAYLTLRPVKTSMPKFAMSLIDLCQQYPVKIAPVRALQQDFVRGDRTRAVAACSPFSDGVAESLQQAGETFYDDFEAILQTESNMSEATCAQLFGVLGQRIEKLREGSDMGAQLLQLCQLLCRLKLCRPLQGHDLLYQWVAKKLDDSSGVASSLLIRHLIATRCIELKALFDICLAPALPTSSKLMIRHLVSDAMSNSPPEASDPGAWYSIRLATQKAMHEHPAALLEILATGEEEEFAPELNPELITNVLSDANNVESLSKEAVIALSRSLGSSFGSEEDVDQLAHMIRHLLKMSNPLAMPYIQFRLRIFTRNAAAKSDDSTQEQIADAVRDCLRDTGGALHHSPRSVRSILIALGPAVSTKVRLRIEHDFFEALPKFLHSRTVSHFPLPSVEDGRHAAQALRLVCMVNGDTSIPQQGAGVTHLVEKLSIYLKCLSSPTMGWSTSTAGSGSVTSPSSTTTPAPLLPDTLRAFLLATIDTLEVMMQMVCLKRAVFHPGQSQPSPTTAKQNQQDQIKLIGLVISVATNQAWSALGTHEIAADHQQKMKNVVAFMFDVAATLVDDMTEESRTFCARLLRDKIKDSRIKWLLGSVKMFGSVAFDDVVTGLELHQPGKGSVGDFKPKVWEMLESSGSQNDACLGLGLFSAKQQ